MKQYVKNYLSLTKKEWNGMVVMLLLIAMVLAAPYALQWLHKDTTINAAEFNAALAQLNKANSGLATDGKSRPKKQLFKFNPNSLPVVKWLQLGLSDKQIAIIKNYEAKGGRFYKPTDLKKIYGISPADYKALQPFVDIPDAPVAKPIIELNKADSAALTALDGIGAAFAKRILYYRERLGGFINKEQLKEVYGLDDVKYREISGQLKVNPALIRKIDINAISFDKLRLMPYLNYKQVNAIIEYRNQHGKYASIDDLANVAILDANILRKIGPYLVFK
ncbi:hypothetical protein FPZ43_10810 [Mucilaginibacter pallidiroseus]|uniref:Helix-hairpin-helix domain-containing protein n=1 Tax=Mucilaginibacter pallidiroseus TaxID=2599295 RepID=A0A563UDR8_9SPHI|nr:helix-hairpin-helix domain-containing protein [Mucilaginibacter pallidiroseus]TWR29433.1 hypothetical protein FPZ43_10810 [Mucilaginibacter pallidiroseus]